MGATGPGARRDTVKFQGRLPSGRGLVIVVSKYNRRRIITVWLAE